MDQQLAPTPSSPSRAWLPIGVASALILSASAVVTNRVTSLNKRLELAESLRENQTTDLREHLQGMQQELSGIRDELGGAVASLESTRELDRRLREAEGNLGAMGAAIEAQSSNLLELEQTQAAFAPGLEKELRERDERLLKRYDALSSMVESARRETEHNQKVVAQLNESLASHADLQAMWRELVGPVVQLAGDTSVGSGVLLRSEPRAEGGYRTRLLTAWHVVRDIQGDPPDLKLPVPVRIYHENGTTRMEQAKLLVHDPKLDAALLELETPDALEFSARLAPRSRLDGTRIFDGIVAVGCPLGNDPIPTRGEIATCQHEVDGERYWMINAPTYIGNSGGGIFDAETHELMGIFSKIYTHGSLRPTIVPHMGLVTPLTKIYDWLVQVGYSEVVPEEAHAGEAAHTGSDG